MIPPQNLKFPTMFLRTAFLLALLLGMGDMFGLWPPTPLLVDAHIIAGLLFLGAVWALATRVNKTAPGASGPLWAALFVVLVGAVIALFMKISGNLLGILHLVLMLVAMGLAEMSVARAVRRGASTK